MWLDILGFFVCFLVKCRCSLEQNSHTMWLYFLTSSSCWSDPSLVWVKKQYIFDEYFCPQSSVSPEPSEAAGGRTQREIQRGRGGEGWRWRTLLLFICWRTHLYSGETLLKMKACSLEWGTSCSMFSLSSPRCLLLCPAAAGNSECLKVPMNLQRVFWIWISDENVQLI